MELQEAPKSQIILENGQTWRTYTFWLQMLLQKLRGYGTYIRTLEKAMAPHSSTLAWKIPWMEPGGLQSMGSLRVGHDWATSLSFSLSCSGEGNGKALQGSCVENPRDRGAWWAAVYGVTQSQTRLKWLSSSSSIRTYIEQWNGTEIPEINPHIWSTDYWQEYQDYSTGKGHFFSTNGAKKNEYPFAK